MFLLTLYDTLSEFKGLIMLVVGVLTTIWLVRSGVIQELSGGHKKLSDLRLAQIEDLKAELASEKEKRKSLEDYNKMLILDSKIRMEIELQLKDSVKKNA